jgi:DNA ligase-1
MPYCFGRSDAVVKVKAFNDVDLRVTGFLEGRGRHKGSLGAILVNFNGVKVRVGSGFGDTDRAEVWADKEKFLGMTAEIRYQEITPDGSLRFPTFVCWRTDK